MFEESIINPKPVIPVAAIGLTPISPVIEVDPVVEIPDFVRITKLPADPRFTVAGPAANVAFGPTRPNINAKPNTVTETLLNFLIIVFISDYLLIIKTSTVVYPPPDTYCKCKHYSTTRVLPKI